MGWAGGAVVDDPLWAYTLTRGSKRVITYRELKVMMQDEVGCVRRGTKREWERGCQGKRTIRGIPAVASPYLRRSHVQHKLCSDNAEEGDACTAVGDANDQGDGSSTRRLGWCRVALFG